MQKTWYFQFGTHKVWSYPEDLDNVSDSSFEPFNPLPYDEPFECAEKRFVM